MLPILDIIAWWSNDVTNDTRNVPIFTMKVENGIKTGTLLVPQKDGSDAVIELAIDRTLADDNTQSFEVYWLSDSVIKLNKPIITKDFQILLTVIACSQIQDLADSKRLYQQFV